MPLRWPDETAWQTLADPLRSVLDPALERLSLRPLTLPPVVAAEPGGARVGAAGIRLDPALLGPGTWHPDDLDWAEGHPHLAALALDRWRRAAGLVLEGVALAALHEGVGAPLPDTWWTIGPAAEAVDRAVPELGWLWPEAADMLFHPEIGMMAEPRRAAWLVRWFRQTDRPWPLGERPDLADADWSAFGAWLEDLSHGPAAGCPVPLLRGPAREPHHVELAPLSHHRVHLSAGAAGATARWPGGVRALAAEEVVEAFVGTVHGGPLDVELDPLLPLGTWVLAGGTVGERPGAARGIELELHSDGSIDVIFADAFAGPPTPYLLGLAKQLGVSGTGTGRFHVVRADSPGHGALVFDDLSPGLLSVHPRFSGRFSLPAETVLGPVNKALAAMVGKVWDFRVEAEELRLETELFGATTVLRLQRPDEDPG